MKRPAAEFIQDAILYLSKWCGLFWLARRLTRKGLRILCYHGFSSGDEIEFRPGLFITMRTFEQRLKTLQKKGFTVLRLGNAIQELEQNAIEECSVVITIDDVFHSVATEAVPLLRKFDMTATAYVTTYYCVKQAPVFGLVVLYMFWKTRHERLTMASVDQRFSGVIDLSDQKARAAAADHIVQVGEALDSETKRTTLARKLGQELGVNFEEIAAARTFHVVSPTQVRDLVDAQIDVQLHTHRHRLPEVAAEVVTEIGDNRSVLEPIVGRRLQHLCYPSGIWSPVVWPWLAEADVVSATTCDPGLNYQDTPRLALKRILDAEDVPQIRFEAEIAGFKPLLRRLRSRIQGMGGN